MATSALFLTRRLLGAGAVLGLAVGVSACGGGGDSSVLQPPPPTPPATGAARFGAGFATSFNASAMSDPREPSLSDIIPLSWTTDPFEVP